MDVTLKVQVTHLEMEKKRLELQYFALHHGFTHPTTVRLSQELDQLFNLYLQLNQK
ncbi:hypothetical protein CN378_10900 [Bacillus sp. AFS015802]|uniref:aspartyl-phosphate phosphatase Spo0E family protein n=1 Tax=Bacillus sp. AFS015802 TaxID=2033486 RepID=UPI000BF95156|nr:aspartyl-phosphate phosphatase Spo0E family protein [Bacillus sp. AFS015802]PFA67346.1 hypothetical protein CN378_10900 [Bacillus sp. AFS015802]